MIATVGGGQDKSFGILAEHDDPTMRAEAVSALGQSGKRDEPAVYITLDAALSDKDPRAGRADAPWGDPPHGRLRPASFGGTRGLRHTP